MRLELNNENLTKLEHTLTPTLVLLEGPRERAEPVYEGDWASPFAQVLLDGQLYTLQIHTDGFVIA